ncbi:MAG: hypothetical protein ACI4P5_03345, partial [Candidatus Fimadaptatus sp.]
MEDDMAFCPRCGTKAVNEVPSNDKTQSPNSADNSFTDNHRQDTAVGSSVEKPHAKSTNTVRKGMKIWMIVCIAFAALFVLTGITSNLMTMAASMGGMFVVLAIMFFVMSKSPKGNRYILGRPMGMTKSLFALTCVVVALAIVVIGAGPGNSVRPQTDNAQNVVNDGIDAKSTDSAEVDNATERPTDIEITLSDIKQWYENQMPAVCQTLINYANTVEGISSINVDESKFRFGEDMGYIDCHYTV